jgi:hypothetical protein
MSALNHFGPSTGLSDAILGQRAPLLFDASLQVRTPQLRQVLDVWNAKRGERRMPSRSDFDMRDLACALPQTSIVQIVHEGDRRRFRIRLMGTSLDQHLAPVTGKFVDEAVPPHFVERWTSLYESAIGPRAPMRVASRTAFRDQLYLIGEGLVLPLSDDGQVPSGVLVVLFHYGSDAHDVARQTLFASLTQELDQEFGNSAPVTS